MLDNMNFYKFMHKQILILIALFAGTSTSYVLFGFIYNTNHIEILWYLFVLLVSLWGYKLYKHYSDTEMTIQEKEKWLSELRSFIFIYFSTWTIMFYVYILSDNIELHYLAIFTQLGVAVVATTILVSEKKLAILILITSMLPITLYLIGIAQFYSYVIAFLTVVLAGVLLYGSRNTFNYLQKSQFQAYHDYLTKLGNRRYFINLLEDAIKIQKNDQQYMYLLLIDLDHFKTINDTLGHDVGDLLLIEVAKRMSDLSLKCKNSVSRLGGDEFCILSSRFANKEECLKSAIQFSEDLLEIIKNIYIIEEHHLYISASIGVSVIDNPKMTATTFIKEADIAMYEAKSQGRDGVIIFNEKLSLRVERKLEIEKQLHFAIQNNEISLNYQPQLDSNSKVIGCEVLVRWNNNELGFVGPDEFIPIAEQTGAIIELGYYILEESLKTFSDWYDRGIHLEQLSINISMRQIFHRNFVDDALKLCAQYLDPKLTNKLMFEMTETSIAEDVDKLIKIMNKIKESGIRFSMDDFGTGYSSLSYLRQVPIDELKIDKSFIFELNNTQDDKKMVKTILDIAKNLDISIVAEGVETNLQKDFLINNSCDILQGYLFSKPVNKKEFERYFLN